MLILIAESKTMAPCDGGVSREAWARHCPALESRADEIMASLGRMNAGELSRAVKISLPLAQKLVRMVYDFGDKAHGGEAISAYTGVVFRAFGWGSLGDEARDATCRRVRIVSSLYGWLRPDDIVKPYRLDFTTALAPGGKTFAAYWRDAVTDALLASLDSGNHGEVLNLLPGDAARCVDWKRVGERAGVWRADFREVKPGGGYRTPNAGRLKALRGSLLRQIITENIADAAALSTLTGDDYMAEGAGNGSIVFTTA